MAEGGAEVWGVGRPKGFSGEHSCVARAAAQHSHERRRCSRARTLAAWLRTLTLPSFLRPIDTRDLFWIILRRGGQSVRAPFLGAKKR